MLAVAEFLFEKWEETQLDAAARTAINRYYLAAFLRAKAFAAKNGFEPDGSTADHSEVRRWFLAHKAACGGRGGAVLKQHLARLYELREWADNVLTDSERLSNDVADSDRLCREVFEWTK
jgi:hypothetical protein